MLFIYLMKRLLSIIYLLVFFGLFLSVNAQNKPKGLLTDLLKNTDIVYINGYPSSVNLWETQPLIEPFQVSEICSSKPSFSWIVPDGGKNTEQSAYRIIISSNQKNAVEGVGDVWDSGMIDSNNSVSIIYSGNELIPSTVYFWRVKTVTNTGGESEWSDIKVFKTSKSLTPYQSSGETLVKSVEYPVTQYKKDNTVFFDFGKAAFGQLLIRLTSETETDSITLYLGEKETNNSVDLTPGGTIRTQIHKLKLLKGTHLYRIKIHKDQRNTLDVAVKMPPYIGEVMPFRYVEIVNYKKAIDKNDIYRESVHYPFDENASLFTSDNDVLNQIWEMSKYTMKATSFAGIYVDGDRERIPYEADILINQLSHYGVDREYSIARRSLEHILEKPTWPTEWILQAIIIAWYDFMYTGDWRSLEENYELLKDRSLMKLKTSKGLISTTTGLQTSDFLKSINFHEPIKDIVDWPHGERDSFIFCDHNSVVNAFYYEALKIMEQIALVLGKKEEADFYLDSHKQLYKVFNDTFFDPSQKLMVDGDTTRHASLHANMFAYTFGLVPPQHHTSVLDFIASKGMACSVYAAQFLMDALYDAGYTEVAENLLLSTSERSWYNMIRSGSTVALEAWDIKFKPNLDWNHAWGAVPANIIPRHLVGVKPLSPGMAEIAIKPQIVSLNHVQSIVPTIRGEISFKYEMQSDNDYTLSLIIPPNMKAEIYLPILKNKKINRILQDGKNLRVRKNSAKAGHYFVGNMGSGEYIFRVLLK